MSPNYLNPLKKLPESNHVYTLISKVPITSKKPVSSPKTSKIRDGQGGRRGQGAGGRFKKWRKRPACVTNKVYGTMGMGRMGRMGRMAWDYGTPRIPDPSHNKKYDQSDKKKQKIPTQPHPPKPQPLNPFRAFSLLKNPCSLHP